MAQLLDPCRQTWRLVFNILDPRGRRQPTPTDCPLMPTQVVVCTLLPQPLPPTHTHTYTHSALNC